MTHPTDEELDALVGMLQQRDKSKHGYTGHPLYNRNGPQAVDALTALRAQLAEVQAELAYANKRIEHAFERNDRQAQTIDELTTRADRAEAALAAQIEDACAVIDAHAEYDQTFCCDGRECGCRGSSVHDMMKHFIRQPHDRTALDRMLRAERKKALRDAADELKGQGYNTAVRQILAMIEQP